MTFQVSIPCGRCPTKIVVGDQFCGGCGRAVTDQDREVLQVRLEGSDYQAYERGKQVRAAAGWIGALAIVFAISGVVMFFIARERVGSLERLDHFSDDAAAEVRRQMALEPYLELVPNLILAVCMGGLWLWARRSPLPAITVAFALFIVVQVGNALVEPRLIFSGLIIKILALVALTKGLMAALEARATLRRPAP